MQLHYSWCLHCCHCTLKQQFRPYCRQESRGDERARGNVSPHEGHPAPRRREPRGPWTRVQMRDKANFFYDPDREAVARHKLSRRITISTKVTTWRSVASGARACYKLQYGYVA
jgi:hypothetical protein